MADRTNATNAWGDGWHFEIQATFAEFLEAAEFVHVQIGVVHRSTIVHVNGDFGVPFDAGDGFNRNFLCSHVSTPNPSAANRS